MMHNYIDTHNCHGVVHKKVVTYVCTIQRIKRLGYQKLSVLLECSYIGM